MTQDPSAVKYQSQPPVYLPPKGKPKAGGTTSSDKAKGKPEGQPALDPAAENDIVIISSAIYEPAPLESADEVYEDTGLENTPELPEKITQLESKIKKVKGGKGHALESDFGLIKQEYEKGNFQQACQMAETLDSYLSLREEIRKDKNLGKMKKKQLLVRLWKEYDQISGQIRNGETPSDFHVAESVYLKARLNSCKIKAKKWKKAFKAFKAKIGVAIDKGDYDTARDLLALCGIVVQADKAANKLGKKIKSKGMPKDLKEQYTMVRYQLRAEIDCILSGKIGKAMVHSSNIKILLKQADQTIEALNQQGEDKRQMNMFERAHALLEVKGHIPGKYLKSIEEEYGIIEKAAQDGHFNEEAYFALQTLGTEVPKIINIVNKDNFYEGFKEVKKFLQELMVAHNQPGAIDVQAGRALAAGIVGHPSMIRALEMKHGQGNITGLSQLGKKQTVQEQLLQLKKFLKEHKDPEALMAYRDIQAYLLYQDRPCTTIHDVLDRLWNFAFMYETGCLPKGLKSPQAQQKFLEKQANHPAVKQALSDIELGEYVQTVKAIGLVIAAIATAEIGGGIIALKLGIGGGIGGFLLTQAIVAPIFSAALKTFSGELGQWVDDPLSIPKDLLIDYGMFVTLGATFRVFGPLLKTGPFATLLQKAFSKAGLLGVEYLAFNGYSFAHQSIEAGLSDELTLSYVFSKENVQFTFKENGIMLVGLKIGNFIVKPILSPLREALLEGAGKPRLTRLTKEIEAFKERSAELTKKLAKFHEKGGTGKEYQDLRIEQLEVLEKKVELLEKLEKDGFATKEDLKEAENALESARKEYQKIDSPEVAEAEIKLDETVVQTSGDVTSVEVPSENKLPVVGEEMLVSKEMLSEVSATYNGETFYLPSEYKAEVALDGATFTRHKAGWKVNIEGAEQITVKFIKSGKEVSPIRHPDGSFDFSWGGYKGDAVITVDGGAKVVKITEPVVEKIGKKSSYNLPSTENCDYEIANQESAQQESQNGEPPKLFRLGKNGKIIAKGVGGISGQIGIVLDGKIVVVKGGERWWGSLTDNGMPEVEAGSHGPCYVVLKKGKNGEPLSMKAEGHEAYLVPNQYAKEVLLSTAREALERKIITTERYLEIKEKTYTHEEYCAELEKLEKADTVAAGDKVADPMFDSYSEFRGFLTDAHQQYFDPQKYGSKTKADSAAVKSWAELMSRKAELKKAYPDMPLYEADARDKVETALDGATPLEKYHLKKIFGTEKPSMEEVFSNIEKLVANYNLGGASIYSKIANAKVGLEMVKHNIKQTQNKIPRRWWEGLTLDMIEPYNTKMADLYEQPYTVLDTPALESYDISIDGKPYRIELRSVENHEGKQFENYYLIEAKTNEAISINHAYVVETPLGVGGTQEVLSVYSGLKHKLLGSVIKAKSNTNSSPVVKENVAELSENTPQAKAVNEGEVDLDATNAGGFKKDPDATNAGEF